MPTKTKTAVIKTEPLHVTVIESQWIRGSKYLTPAMLMVDGNEVKGKMCLTDSERKKS